MFTLSLRHLSVRLPLIALCLAFATWTAMTGIAGLYNFQANSYLELWNQQLAKNNAYQATPEDYQTALFASQRAIELTPYNGDFLTYAADLQMWQLLNNHSLSNKEKQALQTEILTYYRVALKQRPTWANTYANFAIAKTRLNQIDTEMQHALQTANRLGAHEVDILHITIELGLFLWPKLDHGTRLTVASAIERSLTWNLNEKLNQKERVFALSLVGVYQLQKEICPLLTPQSQESSNMCF